MYLQFIGNRYEANVYFPWVFFFFFIEIMLYEREYIFEQYNTKEKLNSVLYIQGNNTSQLHILN